jgi:hypothetical protein
VICFAGHRAMAIAVDFPFAAAPDGPRLPLIVRLTAGMA